MLSLPARRLGILGLCLTTCTGTSLASIVVSVTTFNSDELTVTISGGAGSALEGDIPGQSLDILDFAPGPGYFWISDAAFQTSPSDLSTLPLTNFGNSIVNLTVYDDTAGDTVYAETANDLQPGEYFLADFSISWTGTNLFDPSGVGSDPLIAYWGTNADYDAASGTVQSSSQLNVPEPAGLSAMFGLAALGATLVRRRRN